jgi:hypothetical protein
MLQKLKPYRLPLLLSIATYLVFYYQLLLPNMFFWRNDVETFYFPIRVYIYDSIINDGRLPFWTEKMFSGFPLYADLEASVLHLPNVISILLFGPVWSYKIWHLGSYLLGSMSLYVLLRRKMQVNIAGFFVANAIFYFSFFQQYRMSHFNITLVTYLLPTYLLLADYFIERRKVRYIVLNSVLIASAVYWGHMQTVLIMLIGIFIYTLIFGYRQLKLAAFTLYWAIFGLLVFIQTLPQLYSTYLLLEQSRRIAGDMSFLEGSFSPFMALFYIYPTLFGVWPQNFGDSISFDYTLIETSIYLGIVAFILGLAGFIFTKNNTLKTYASVLFWLFLILGFMRFTPLLGSIEVPVISLFRHWPRVVVLAVFGFSAMAAAFVTHGVQNTRKQILKNLGLALIPVGYLGFLTFINRDNSLMIHTINTVRRHLRLVLEPNFSIWLPLLVTSAVLVVLLVLFRHYRYTKISSIIVLLLCAAVLFDLRYFAQNPLEQRIHNISRSLDNTYIPTFSPGLDNTRIVHISNTKKLNGNAGLYNNNWWPYGYSQLGNIEYEHKFIKTSRGTSVRNINKHPITRDSHDKLRELGIYAIIHNSRQINLFPEDISVIELTNPALPGDYLIKKEGHIKFRVDVDEAGIVRTSIKNFPGWQVKVNDKVVKIDNSSSLFMNIFLEQGSNVVEFRYVAWPVYYALVVSAVLLGGLVGLYFIFKQRLTTLLQN